VIDSIRAGMQPRGYPTHPVCWKNSNLALNYDRFVFEPNESALKPTEYNLYIRPNMKEPDFDVTKLMFFDYLKRVISNNDELVYRCLVHHIAKIIRVGKTKLGLVLMGMKGTGKSTFAMLIGWLVGMDYYFLEQDITNLKKEFNGHMENNIVLHIEEVPNEA